MTLYEFLYGGKCKSPICCVEFGEQRLLGPEIVHITREKVKLMRERLKTTQSTQNMQIPRRPCVLESISNQGSDKVRKEG